MCQKSKWFVINNPRRLEKLLGDARVTRPDLAFNVELNQYIAGASQQRGICQCLTSRFVCTMSILTRCGPVKSHTGQKGTGLFAGRLGSIGLRGEDKLDLSTKATVQPFRRTKRPTAVNSRHKRATSRQQLPAQSPLALALSAYFG